MIFYSMLTCTIGSQGGPNKMAAANFLWLSEQQKLDPVFFLDQCTFSMAFRALLLSRDVTCDYHSFEPHHQGDVVMAEG